MTIEERQKSHEQELEKLEMRRERMGSELKKVNNKIAFHWGAIHNLVKKKLKPKAEDI